MDAADTVERAAREERSTGESVDTSGLASRPADVGDRTEDVSLIAGASRSGLRRREGLETLEDRREARALALETMEDAEADAVIVCSIHWLDRSVREKES